MDQFRLTASKIKVTIIYKVIDLTDKIRWGPKKCEEECD